jgi:putative DNA topoisomerase
MKTIIMLFVATLATFTTFAQKNKANSPASKSHTAIQTSYTCPMHRDVVSNKPGKCPQCQSKLVVDRRGTKQAAIVYTCGMHPDVASDTAGNCPICGMDMVAQKTKKD